MKAQLERILTNSNFTIGKLTILSPDNVLLFSCSTLELGWNGNLKTQSCIPIGNYTLHPHVSPRFKNCFFIPFVPNRSQILVHVGNYTKNTKGCILVGQFFDKYTDQNNPKLMNSQKTLDHLLQLIQTEIELKIY